MSFADTALAFDDLAAVAKTFHQRVNFKLTHVLWLAALQTIAKTDGALLKQIAEKAGLQVPEAEELAFEKETGRAFAAAYDKMLGGGKRNRVVRSKCGNLGERIYSQTVIINDNHCREVFAWTKRSPD